jgi:hypothetical protein
VDLGVVERAVAPAREEEVQLPPTVGVDRLCQLDEEGELEQLGPHGGHAISAEQHGPAAERVTLLARLGNSAKLACGPGKAADAGGAAWSPRGRARLRRPYVALYRRPPHGATVAAGDNAPLTSDNGDVKVREWRCHLPAIIGVMSEPPEPRVRWWTALLEGLRELGSLTKPCTCGTRRIGPCPRHGRLN